MILSSDSFDKVLNEYVLTSKRKKCKAKVIDYLLRLCLPIGYLRWISSENQENLNLKFTGLKYKKFIDKSSLDTDIDKLMKTVKDNSQKPYIIEEPIKKNIINMIAANKHDPWLVCHGEDMIQVLLIGLHDKFGSRKSKELTADILHSIVRVSYEYDIFKTTKLYKSIEKWGKNNRSFLSD